MITITNGVFHTPPGLWLDESRRTSIKRAGFVFHWGVDAIGPRGGKKCHGDCPGCAAGLPDKVWCCALHTFVAELGTNELDDVAKEAVEVALRKESQSRASSSAFQAPAPDGLAYFPYQLAAIEYASSRKRVLFGDEMGLGKSIEALGWANACGARLILIVCPASLKLNWARECDRWLVRRSKIHVQTDAGLPANDAEVVIVNYERLIGRRGEALVESLMSAASWDLLIVDEAHRIKTSEAQRSKAILGAKDKSGLIDVAERVAFLTGTPVPNRPRELLPVVSAMNPSVFGNEWKFLQRYCGPERKSIYIRGGAQKDIWTFDGASNLAELQSVMRSSFMIRRLKADVLTELPAKLRSVVPVESNAKADAYSRRWERDSRVREFLAEDSRYEQEVLKLSASNANAVFEEMAAGRRELGELKVPHAIAHIESLLSGGCEKLVVFAHHHSVIEALAQALGDQSVTLYGPMAEKDRQQSVDLFQSDPSKRVFIGSIGAAGVGLTLTAASRVLFVESSWVPSDLSQCEDRVHRVGQTRGVIVEHLVFDGTIDVAILQRVLAKQRVLDAVLDAEGEP